MNNELLTTTLNQGLQFQKYQNKITKKLSNTLLNKYTPSVNIPSAKVTEGFISNTDNTNNTNSNLTQKNRNDIMELNKLKTDYDSLVEQYNSAQASITNTTNTYVDRTTTQNPYAGKNIKLSGNGALGYVTKDGVYKWYNNWDTINNTAGKNGCPTLTESSGFISINETTDDYNVTGTIIPTNPKLIVGGAMVSGQSCGNEGTNVFVVPQTNTTAKYNGCYSNIPPSTISMIVPIMPSSNSKDGFISYSSSTYQNNNDNFGPWRAFDQNMTTYWHSSTDASNLYDSKTGEYIGTTSVQVNTKSNGLQIVKGEFLQINLPGFNTSSAQNISVSKYDVQGRQDCCGTPNGRNPHTWYILGWKDSQWYEVDYQENQDYDRSLKTYTIDNPQPYSAYIIITIVCGDTASAEGNKSCVQISAWNLYGSQTTSNAGENALILQDDGAITFNYDSCKQRAIDTGNKYFALQNFQNGMSQCGVSNDYDSIIKYGPGDTYIMNNLWSAMSASTNSQFILENDGNLYVRDIANGNVIYNSKTGNNYCGSTPSEIVATYGSNCVSSHPDIVPGNWTSYITNIISGNPGKPSYNYTVGDKDPAPGCSKSFDISYMCGTVPKTGHLDNEAWGRTITLDCAESTGQCYCYLILEDGGQMTIYKGDSPENNQGVVYKWPKYDVTKSAPNPTYSVANSSTQQNWIKGGTGLNIGEWIVSNDGLIILMMQTDGNLTLSTFTENIGCKKQTDSNMYGNQSSNALYELDPVPDNTNLGKIGYVDASGKLREYPADMVGLSNTYRSYPNYDSPGNDLENMPITNSTKSACQTACDNNMDCGGFMFDNSTKNCYLKTSSVYPKSARNPYKNADLYVRNPKIINSENVTKNIVDIDSSTWANYQKNGVMKPNEKFGLAKATNKQQQHLQNLRDRLHDIGTNIVGKINNLQSENVDLNSSMTQINSDLDENIKQYTDVNNKFIKIKNNNNETINGMVSNSDLVVLQENYGYMFWSIFAVGLLVVTLNSVKKT
jgi:hypothetical protein